jgi:hypothetical protein
MRLPVLILLFIAAALLSESIGASAQSARSYPGLRDILWDRRRRDAIVHF